MHSDSDIDIREKIREVECGINELRESINNNKKYTSDRLEEIHIQIKDIFAKINAESNKNSEYYTRIKDELSSDINNMAKKQFDNTDKQLREDIQKRLTERDLVFLSSSI